MAKPNSAKTLLEQDNQNRYNTFIVNDDESLILPALSSNPWIAVSKRREVYVKKRVQPDEASLNHVAFIEKNNEPHAFLWKTDANTLKKAVRWGIIKPHSITSKVISALGEYRIVAHKRIAKGMYSNSQVVKLRLLDVFQARFEALQAIESLVNRANTLDDYTRVFQAYQTDLDELYQSLDERFAEVLNQAGFDKAALEQIKQDVQTDIQKAKSYLKTVPVNPTSHNQAVGYRSVLEFVKKQMIRGLSELQGINQDMTYSHKRRFALTRGELNDFIEDACKAINLHQPDLCNTIDGKHHGLYGDDPCRVTYDFSQDNLSTDRQREVLLAISFIEGWDRVQTNLDGSLRVSNASGTEELDIIYSTKWTKHRTFSAFLLSIGHAFKVFFESIFVSTKPWEEEVWSRQDFHLEAVGLRAHVPNNKPLWYKPYSFLKQLGQIVTDILSGIYDFGSQISIQLPSVLLEDWEASKALPPLFITLQEIEKAISEMHETEKQSLQAIFEKLQRRDSYTPGKLSPPTSELAIVDYQLEAGDQNDLLNAVARGLIGFSGIFTEIYAKDPVAGLGFTAAYAAGAGAILFPAQVTPWLGGELVQGISQFGYMMSSSTLGAAVGVGATLGQGAVLVCDSTNHGPSGIAINMLSKFSENPLTIGAYFAAAYALGYFAVNGIAGRKIPIISHYLREELGTNPSLSYPVMGAKGGILTYEIFTAEAKKQYPNVQLTLNKEQLASLAQQISMGDSFQKYWLIAWLSLYKESLPRLEARHLVQLAKHIDQQFPEKEDRQALYRLIYPKRSFSIAYQSVAIPLFYIPAVLRLIASFFVSVCAVLANHKHPGAPMQRAFRSLKDKIQQDTSRLVNFVTNLGYFVYDVSTCVGKATAYVGTMLVGRIAAFWNGKPGHAMHKGFAGMRLFLRGIVQLFYPVKAMKYVSDAHPIVTIKKVETSYLTLLKRVAKLPRSLDKPLGVGQEGNRQYLSKPKTDARFGGKREGYEIPHSSAPEGAARSSLGAFFSPNV